MKVKKILFITSGVIKCAVGGMMILLFGMVLLLNGFLKNAFIESSTQLVELINELVSMDSSYAYLLEYSHEQMADFILSTINTFAIVMVIMGIIGVVLGVFNFIFAKKYGIMLQGRRGRKIALTVISFICYWEIISNIFTTIALFSKDEKMENTIIIN